MKPLALAALLLAAPLLAATATAAEIPPEGEKTVGPCTYTYSWWWPGSHSYVSCTVEGREVLWYGSWETWGGSGCELRVAGEKVHGCNES